MFLRTHTLFPFVLIILLYPSAKARSLGELVQRYVDKSPTLSASAARQRASFLEWEAVKFQVLPEVFLSGQTLASRTPFASFGFPALPGFEGLSGFDGFAERHTYAIKLNIEQPIYVGGRVGQGYTLKGLAYKEAQWRHQSERQRLIFQFLISLIQYLNFDEQMAIIKKSQGTQKRFLELTRNRYRKGIARAYEVQQAEAELLSFAPRMEQLEKEQQALLRQLQTQLDMEGEAVGIQWPDTPTITTSAPSLTPEILNLAKEQNPGYQRALLQVEMTKVQKEFDMGAYRPSVTLSGSWGGLSQKVTQLWKSESMDYSIVLNLRVPLFSRFSSLYTRKIGQENMDFAEKNKHRVEQDLKLALKKSILDYQASLKRWKQTRKWRQKARQALQSGEKSYRIGVVGSFQIHQLQRGSEAASLSFIQARGEMRIAEVNYSLALGEDLYQKYVPSNTTHKAQPPTQ